MVIFRVWGAVRRPFCPAFSFLSHLHALACVCLTFSGFTNTMVSTTDKKVRLWCSDVTGAHEGTMRGRTDPTLPVRCVEWSKHSLPRIAIDCTAARLSATVLHVPPVLHLHV